MVAKAETSPASQNTERASLSVVMAIVLAAGAWMGWVVSLVSVIERPPALAQSLSHQTRAICNSIIGIDLYIVNIVPWSGNLLSVGVIHSVYIEYIFILI